MNRRKEGRDSFDRSALNLQSGQPVPERVVRRHFPKMK